MSVEDAIKSFSSRYVDPREQSENQRGHVIPVGSHGSHSSQQESLCKVNNKASLEDLLKLHPSIVMGCKLIDILERADLEDYQDLKCLEVLKAFALGLLKIGEIHIIETMHFKD